MLMILYLVLPSICIASCVLPGILSDESLQQMSVGCVEVVGNLRIQSSISNELLIHKFQNVITISGCVSIGNTTLVTFDFMNKVRTINCSLNQGHTGVNVIDIKYNADLLKLNWNSLETIVGPGTIDLTDSSDYLCLTLHEIELFLFHPQYFGTQWGLLIDVRGRCYREGCSYHYHNGKGTDHSLDQAGPEEFRMAKGCRVLVQFDMNSPGIGYIPLFDDLKDVRIILGGIHIENSYLTNISFFPNVELIYTSTSGYNSLFPIRLVGNPYMSDIRLPKLSRFISSQGTPVVVEGSPLLSSENPYKNVTNIFVEDLWPPMQTWSPITNGSTDFVRITSRHKFDDYALRYNLLVYGMYYPPIVIAILFNLRAAILFVFGGAKYAIAGLRWFYIYMVVVHLLIAFDSSILYHDLSLVYFTPAPLIANKILYNDVLRVFCKTLFVIREIAMDLPLLSVVYVFLVAITKQINIPVYMIVIIYSVVVVGYCGYVAISLYSTLEIGARLIMNALPGKLGAIPMDKYAIIASVNGKFSPESTVRGTSLYDTVSVFEKTIYTDGLELTETKQQLEYVTMGLFGIYLVVKLLDQKRRLSALPYDVSVIAIILQYSVLRYAALRNYLFRSIYRIRCIGYKECAEPYTYDDTITMITHHGVYVLLAFCSILVWYTARHFHFLGKLMKREKDKLDAAKLEQTTYTHSRAQ